MTAAPRPLRVLQILEATLGGTARHVVDLCRGLKGRGHEVHLIYNPRADRMDAIFAKGVPALAAQGVEAVPMAMPRAVGGQDARVLRDVRAYIRSQGPFDILHGHSSKAGAYARLGGLGLPGARVYTPHAFVTGDPALGARSRLVYGLMERLLGRLGHGLIAVSEEEREIALRLGVPGGRIRLVPNGADVPSGSRLDRRGLGLPEGALVVGFVGRFAPQKSPANLLRAFARLDSSLGDIRLAMVGSGPLEPSLKAESRSLGIDGRVHWLGVQDGPAAMCAFDIFALPSLYEGLPYVLIEAMSRSLPIVTTDVGGARTLIEENGNGFIVPPGRPDRLADALAALARDATLRERMGKESLRRSALFSIDRMVDGIESFYHTLSTRFGLSP